MLPTPAPPLSALHHGALQELGSLEHAPCKSSGAVPPSSDEHLGPPYTHTSTHTDCSPQVMLVACCSKAGPIRLDWTTRASWIFCEELHETPRPASARGFPWKGGAVTLGDGVADGAGVGAAEGRGGPLPQRLQLQHGRPEQRPRPAPVDGLLHPHAARERPEEVAPCPRSSATQGSSLKYPARRLPPRHLKADS